MHERPRISLISSNNFVCLQPKEWIEAVAHKER